MKIKKPTFVGFFIAGKADITWQLVQLQQLVQQELLQQQQMLRQQLVQQEQLQQRIQQLVLQQQLEFQRLFRHKRSKQEPTEQQRERIISWLIPWVSLIKKFVRLRSFSQNQSRGILPVKLKKSSSNADIYRPNVVVDKVECECGHISKN